MLEKTKELKEGTGIYIIYCKGCGHYHNFHTKSKNKIGAKWSFNHNLEQPTFTPSLLVTHETINKVCHSLVTVGFIEYLDDCTHELKGQTIELSEIHFD